MSDLKACALNEFPELSYIINADSESSVTVWNSDLSTGKALEFLTMLALVSEIKRIGAELIIDPIFIDNPNLYYLRNEIPCHHGAQAGHDAALNNEFQLEDRFLSAVTPRAAFVYKGEDYMLFREGNPLHLIESLIKDKGVYKERPDFVVVEGSIKIASVKNGRLVFVHTARNGCAEIELIIKNSNLIPLSGFEAEASYEVETKGVIECSVSKTKANVDKQLDTYVGLFGASLVVPDCLFVHGKSATSKYKTALIDMETLVEDIRSVSNRQIFSDFLERVLA